MGIKQALFVLRPEDFGLEVQAQLKSLHTEWIIVSPTTLLLSMGVWFGDVAVTDKGWSYEQAHSQYGVIETGNIRSASGGFRPFMQIKFDSEENAMLFRLTFLGPQTT